MVSYGLIAGLSLPDMLRLKPGMVLDLFVWRQKYDDELHGVKRG